MELSSLASGTCARLGECLTVGASDVIGLRCPTRSECYQIQTNAISKMFYNGARGAGLSLV
jgi:hypothetical protein